ncbi:MAG: transposase [Planctomycetota bacterium]|jgi:transposase
MTKKDQDSSLSEGEDQPLVAPKVTEDERSETEGTAGATNGSIQSNSNSARPNPEVPAIARRRRFTAEYKQLIVREAEECSQPGEIGALLRREGLYSSILADWRRQSKRGSFNALSDKKRGPKPNPSQELVRENAMLKKKLSRLERELKTAELIIDVQKKVSEVLGIRLSTPEEENDS